MIARPSGRGNDSQQFVESLQGRQANLERVLLSLPAFRALVLAGTRTSSARHSAEDRRRHAAALQRPSGHSDGDVLLHALTDALLGAIAAGDIGTYFPPSDPKWKGADSVLFVQEALRRVDEAGYQVGNVDSTLILAEPKIGPHAADIQKKVAELLRIEPSRVGIKAKTPEGMGTDHAAIAHVAVLLVEINWP